MVLWVGSIGYLPEIFNGYNLISNDRSCFDLWFGVSMIVVLCDYNIILSVCYVVVCGG